MRKGLGLEPWDAAMVSCGGFGHLEWRKRAYFMRKSTELLFDVARTRRFSPEYTLFPILSRYRETFELLLKSAIQTLSERHSFAPDYDETIRVLPIHDLEKLVEHLETALEKVQGNIETDKEFLAPIRSLASQFMEVDPRATAFRYPVEKKGGDASAEVFCDPHELRHLCDEALDNLEVICEIASQEILDHCEEY